MVVAAPTIVAHARLRAHDPSDPLGVLQGLPLRRQGPLEPLLTYRAQLLLRLIRIFCLSSHGFPLFACEPAGKEAVNPIPQAGMLLHGNVERLAGDLCYRYVSP